MKQSTNLFHFNHRIQLGKTTKVPFSSKAIKSSLTNVLLLILS